MLKLFQRLYFLTLSSRNYNNYFQKGLIDYILELEKKKEEDVKDKIISLFKTDKTKNYSKPTRVNNVYGGEKSKKNTKTKKQLDDNIIKNARSLF